MEIYVYDNCVILNDASVDEDPVGHVGKQWKNYLFFYQLKDQENKNFNKPPGRHVLSVFDKYMIIRTNYMSSNNFLVM